MDTETADCRYCDREIYRPSTGRGDRFPPPWRHAHNQDTHCSVVSTRVAQVRLTV